MPPKRNGAPYRRIVITFWNDPDVKNVLTRDEKLFANYVFTNEHSHPCGVYRLSPLYVMDELEFTKEEMRAMLAGPLAPFMTYDWRTEEIFVHAMAEHQIDGNGLHGKDRRIAWVKTQLQMVHSRPLLEAFRTRYGDWNLPWEEVLPPCGEGAYPVSGMGHSMPLAKPLNHAEKEGASEARARPSFQLTDPDSSSNTPASSSDSEGATVGHTSDPEAGEREGDHEERPAKPKHPELERLWAGGVMDVVRRGWHQGRERVELPDGKSVGIGLEYWLFNDLLHATDDPDMAVWVVQDAPAVLGWDSEPRTLYWALRGQNFDAAFEAYLGRHPPERDPTAGMVHVKRIPNEARAS